MGKLVQYKPEQGKILLYSESVEPIIKQFYDRYQNISFAKVKSGTFGGNINVAGNLLIDDYLKCLRNFKKLNDDDILILPRVSFNDFFYDLSGQDLDSFFDIINNEVLIVESPNTN